MHQGFTVGDVIRKARRARGWSQAKLGEEAKQFVFHQGTPKIDKSTVSEAERDPYKSRYGTIIRLLAALDLTMCEVEAQVGPPFGDARRALSQTGPTA